MLPSPQKNPIVASPPPPRVPLPPPGGALDKVGTAPFTDDLDDDYACAEPYGEVVDDGAAALEDVQPHTPPASPFDAPREVSLRASRDSFDNGIEDLDANVI